MTSNTVHPLMVPRFEVVLDYPNSDFYVGDIIEMDCKTDFFTGEDEWQTKVIRNKKGGSGIYCVKKFEPHPAIFKPLQWWEHREASEMPEYVKTDLIGGVHRVLKARFDHESTSTYWLFIDELGIHPYNPSAFLPATLEEYTEYINQKQIVK